MDRVHHGGVGVVQFERECAAEGDIRDVQSDRGADAARDSRRCENEEAGALRDGQDAVAEIERAVCDRDADRLTAVGAGGLLENEIRTERLTEDIERRWYRVADFHTEVWSGREI